MDWLDQWSCQHPPLFTVYNQQPKISKIKPSTEPRLKINILRQIHTSSFNPYGLNCFLDTQSSPPFPFPLLPSLYLTLSLSTPLPLPEAFASPNLSTCIRPRFLHSPTPIPPLPLSIHSPLWSMLHCREVSDTTTNKFMGQLTQFSLLLISAS